MLLFKPAPFVDESLAGYLLRLAEANYLRGPRDLLRLCGLRQAARYAEADVQRLAGELGLDAEALWAAARFDQAPPSLAQGLFLRSTTIPVCPGCLSETGYIRQGWHHQLVTACVTHGCYLIDACPVCETPLALNRAAVGHCRCGYALNALPATPADPANRLVSGVLMGDAASQDRLWGWTGQVQLPSDLDEFLLFLGNLHLSPPQRKNAAIDFARALELNRAVYRMAQDLPARFRAFVEDRVGAANAMESTRFVKNLGTWYRTLNLAFAGEAYQPVRHLAYRVILDRAQAPINRKLKQIGAELQGLKSTYTAAEAARLLGSSPDRIVSFVKAGRLRGHIQQGGSVEFCLVERADVEAQQAAAAGLLFGREVQKRLNISRRLRERLVACGELARVSEADKPPFARGDYRREDAERLLATLARTLTPADVADTLALEDLNGRAFSHAQAQDVLRQIFDGRLRPVQQREGVAGLAGYRFDRREVQALLSEQGAFELTVTDLTRLTRWKHETIKAWIAHGLLPARRQDDGKTLIALADLICFLSRYVVAADAAQRLATRSVWLTKALSAHGVLEARHHTGSGALRGVLLKVDALINLASGRPVDWIRGAEPATADGRRSAEEPRDD